MKKTLFIIILSIMLGSLFTFFTASAGYKLEVAIPGVAETEPSLSSYIRYLYLFGLGAVSLAALGTLVIGGFMYMGGDTVTSKEKAKEYIWGALSGLVLALAAYLILYTINPDLLKNEPPVLTPPTMPSTLVPSHQ